MTLGQALAAQVRLIVWCKTCWHRAEPDIADQVARYGADTAVIDWARRLRCSACEGHEGTQADGELAGAMTGQAPTAAPEITAAMRIAAA